MSTEYCLYLDEQDANAKCPFFCLAGVAISREEYEKNLIPKINDLKKQYFATTDVVFHYSEMKNNKGCFSQLHDGPTRDKFWNDLNSIIRKTKMMTMGTYLDVSVYEKVYGKTGNKKYELSFRRLINNYITFLRMSGGVGDIVFESRSWNENKMIQEVFHSVLAGGTDIFSADECKKYMSTIGFITKKDNCVGLQVADFVPNSFMRDINHQKNFHNVGTYFINKKFKVKGAYEDICGLTRIM